MSKYFISRNGSKQGPYTLVELASMEIRTADLIWKEGMEDWKEADKFDELQEIIQTPVPELPTERRKKELMNIYRSKVYIPLIIGLTLGMFSILAWDNEKKSIYGNRNPEIPNTQTAAKYLAGEYGYAAERAEITEFGTGVRKFGTEGGQVLAANEDFYFNNYEQGVFRPVKALFVVVAPKTQFYTGRQENMPFIQFILTWIVLSFCIYGLGCGVHFLINRNKKT